MAARIVPSLRLSRWQLYFIRWSAFDQGWLSGPGMATKMPAIQARGLWTITLGGPVRTALIRLMALWVLVQRLARPCGLEPPTCPGLSTYWVIGTVRPLVRLEWKRPDVPDTSIYSLCICIALSTLELLVAPVYLYASDCIGHSHAILRLHSCFLPAIVAVEATVNVHDMDGETQASRAPLLQCVVHFMASFQVCDAFLNQRGALCRLPLFVLMQMDQLRTRVLRIDGPVYRILGSPTIGYALGESSSSPFYSPSVTSAISGISSWAGLGLVPRRTMVELYLPSTILVMLRLTPSLSTNSSYLIAPSR